MKNFILHWLDGTDEEVQGNSISDAFTRAGYGGGAIRALDYYEEKDKPVKEENEDGKA